jgi:DNA-binding GntR family transcriptional regulator
MVSISAGNTPEPHRSSCGTFVPLTQILEFRHRGPGPLYHQLAQSFEEAVASGKIPHGTRLLPEAKVALELRVALSTVRQAWSYLERKGLLTRTRKTGTFVL